MISVFTSQYSRVECERCARHHCFGRSFSLKRARMKRAENLLLDCQQQTNVFSDSILEVLVFFVFLLENQLNK